MKETIRIKNMYQIMKRYVWFLISTTLIGGKIFIANYSKIGFMK
ncbi:hypothetical protein [Listeria sp. SHR_NRA_18]|nr:hypothetical protein [Listeria sp. SHR_NRA_18]